jgi:uncharacterized protein (DUF1501 family)
MKRRNFLGGVATLAAVQALGGLIAPPGWIIRPAHAFNGKTLLVVFLRGACDGLNVVVPYGDDEYHRLRPAIRIPPPGAEFAAIDLDGFFGFHPQLAGLAELYHEGLVAVLPAVQYANASRSHFEGQELIERTGVFDGSGWLNRHLQSVGGGDNGLAGLALGRSVPFALRGAVPVGALTGLVSATLSGDPAEEARLMQVLARHHQHDVLEGTADPELRVRQGGAIGLANLGLIRSLQPESYQPAPGVVYPETDFGRRLRDVAFLVKNSVGLEVASTDMVGWDTHFNQGAGGPEGRQAVLLAELGAGLHALMTDLGSRTRDLCVVVMTEFGRTAKQNASGGTDHGNASAWFVIGGGVEGGIHLGPTGWPGLLPDQLRDGRDLMHTVDYRDILAEVLVNHLGDEDVDAVLPAHAPTPLGLFAG